jgi:hypothetical protein
LLSDLHPDQYDIWALGSSPIKMDIKSAFRLLKCNPEDFDLIGITLDSSESIVRPKYSIFVHGPTVFSSAIGTPKGRHTFAKTDIKILQSFLVAYKISFQAFKVQSRGF